MVHERASSVAFKGDGDEVVVCTSAELYYIILALLPWWQELSAAARLHRCIIPLE